MRIWACIIFLTLKPMFVGLLFFFINIMLWGYNLLCVFHGFGDEIFIIALEQGLKFPQKILRKQLRESLKTIRKQYWSSAIELMVSVCSIPPCLRHSVIWGISTIALILYNLSHNLLIMFLGWMMYLCLCSGWITWTCPKIFAMGRSQDCKGALTIFLAACIPS